MVTEKASGHSKSSEKATVGWLSEKLVEKAITALLQHHGKSTKESNDLLGNETFVHVQLGLDVAPKRAHIKPIRIDIPHGFQEDPQVCLIVKQESKAWVKDLLSKFPEMKCVKKVIGLESLRTKYADYAQRRELLHTYNVFMADDRILPMLSSALGKMFYKAKQQPIPIRIVRKTALPYHIIKALKSTFLSYAKGTSVSVIAGRTDMDVHQLVQNVLAIAPQAASKIPRKWANVRSIGLKTPLSVSLPIYNKTPEELIEIARLASLAPAWKDAPPEEVKPEKTGAQEATSKSDKHKSPLLKALKKQKKEDQEKIISNDEKKGDAEVPKEATADAEGTRKDHSKARKKHKEDHKKSGGKSAAEIMGDAEGMPSQVPKRARADAEEMGKDDSKTKEGKKSDYLMTKERKKKAKTEKDLSKTDEQRVAFLPAKAYNGTKSGYVFKRGAQGLGYYLDVKPLVDKMAMEALLRLAEQKNSSSRQKKSSKRRGRH